MLHIAFMYHCNFMKISLRISNFCACRTENSHVNIYADVRR